MIHQMLCVQEKPGTLEAGELACAEKHHCGVPRWIDPVQKLLEAVLYPSFPEYDLGAVLESGDEAGFVGSRGMLGDGVFRKPVQDPELIHLHIPGKGPEDLGHQVGAGCLSDGHEGEARMHTEKLRFRLGEVSTPRSGVFLLAPCRHRHLPSVIVTNRR